MYLHCRNLPSLVLAASSEAIFDAEMATLAAEEASIVVLLAEGFDGAIVRTVLSQVCTGRTHGHVELMEEDTTQSGVGGGGGVVSGRDGRK